MSLPISSPDNSPHRACLRIRECTRTVPAPRFSSEQKCSPREYMRELRPAAKRPVAHMLTTTSILAAAAGISR
jgi:hypothetical protein